MSTLPTFGEAAARQFRFGSYYTVWLVGPRGEREYLGYTARKSAVGLRAVLAEPIVQERLRQLPDAESITWENRRGALHLSSGHRIEFGGTIRQESSEQTAR